MQYGTSRSHHSTTVGITQKPTGVFPRSSWSLDSPCGGHRDTYLRHAPTGDPTLTPLLRNETGHTWHHADQWLFDVIKYGGKHHTPPRYRSAMPAHHEMLSDAEIWAVLAFIKSCWPAAIRAQ